MDCCSPKPKRITIETTVLNIDGATCERCSATTVNARGVADELTIQLKPLGVEVSLVEHAAAMGNLTQSNSVLINDKPIEEWLGATRVSTECPSCCKLSGEENVCCGAMLVDETVHESYTADQIRRAALMALSAVTGGKGCC